jgi:hypothetical protein
LPPYSDAFGYQVPARPRGGGAYSSQGQPQTQQQFRTNRQYERNQQGDNRSRYARPRLGRSSSNRQNVYGSANPYQNTTNQNPYVGIAWLGSGFPHPLPQVPQEIPPAPSFAPVQPGGARPNWDLAGIAALLGPYFHVPIREDYNLNLKLRESIPLIDAAILRMKDLIGFPEIEAAPNLKENIDNFLANLPVNRIQQGAKTWARTHLDNAYTFGRAHAEVILTYDKKDVFGVVEVHPATTGLRPTFDGYAVNVVQYQYGGGVPITLVPELLLTSVHDFRGDDPNGSSLIASLPFVSEILIKMFRSMGQTWERFGTPNYHVNWEPPDDWNDPTGKQTADILAPMQQNLYQSDLDRANGKIRHFWTTGKVSLDVLGAQGQVLEFEESARKFAEEITSKTGIPPFMLGLSWSTTERMSTSQAKLLTEVIDSGRHLMTPVLEQLIRLHLKLSNKRGKFSLRWPEVSLMDLVDTARAAWMDAQADAIKIENYTQLGRLGIYSMPEIAQQFRPDLEDLTPLEIIDRLNGEEGSPMLVEAIPMPEPVQVAQVRSGSATAPLASGHGAGGPGHEGGPQSSRRPAGSVVVGGSELPDGMNPKDQATGQPGVRSLIDQELADILAEYPSEYPAGRKNGKH